MQIRQLRDSDDRSQFDCGSTALNAHIREFAGQNQRRRASVTFVALEGDANTKVVGFVTVCGGTILRGVLPADLSRGFSQQPQPTLVVARLGVDVTHQGQGIGSGLLVRALRQEIAQAGASGCIGVEVEPKEGKERFYEGRGFMRLETADQDAPVRMFLPISAIWDAFQGDPQAS